MTPVAGDILEPTWGLSPTVAKDIASSVDVIIHNAADTSFAARRERDPLIVYMSTASNVGQVSGCDLSEDDGCRPDNVHFNEYTQSKAIGEQLLRASGLPVLILRPTIVLSVGLPDPLFARQILWCAPLGRAFKALPIDPAGRVDIVDVEFVAEATLRLLEKPDRSYDCYNLSAGPRGCVSMGELCDLVDRAYHRRNHLSLVPPAEWTRAMLRENVKTPLQRRVFRSLRHYFPFLNMDVAYNDARLRKELGSSTPRVQPIESYPIISPFAKRALAACGITAIVEAILVVAMAEPPVLLLFALGPILFLAVIVWRRRSHPTRSRFQENPQPDQPSIAPLMVPLAQWIVVLYFWIAIAREESREKSAAVVSK